MIQPELEAPQEMVDRALEVGGVVVVVGLQVMALLLQI
jgi:hypothetical protein